MNLRRRNSILRLGATRRGITLLEVVIAMAIFVMTLPALNALVLLGMQRAEETRILSTASLMCRSKMAEFAAGSVPFASSDWAPLDDPNWQWKADAGNAAGVAGMQTIQVSVKLDNGSGVNYEQTLVQMVLDPAQRGSTQDRYLLNPAGSGTSSSQTTNSSSGTTPSATGATGTGASGTGSTGTGAASGSGGGSGAASGSGGGGASTGMSGGGGGGGGGGGAKAGGGKGGG